MKQQDETYRPKVTDTDEADRQASAVAVQTVSSAHTLQTVTQIIMIVVTVLAILWGVK